MSRLLRWLKYLIGAVIVFAVAVNFWIKFSTESSIYANIQNIPERDIALILGTSKKMVGGQDNQFFLKRISAAAELYHKKKVKHLLVSGDNRTQYYNEPKDMYEALRALDVPNDAITLDYAGLRTFDSVVRCKEIFGQQSVVIITQKFHSHRALFIAKHYGIDAVGYAADFPDHEGAIKIVVREYFARVKAVLDLYVFKMNPRHLGDKEEIEIN